MLKEFNVQLPFDAGPDEHHDARLLQPGQQSSAINVDWSREGAAQKRAGYSELSKTYTNPVLGNGSNASVGLLAGIGQQLVMLDTNRLRASTPTNWADQDHVSPCVGRYENVSTGGGPNVYASDIAVITGTSLYIYVYVSYSGPFLQMFCSIVDTTSGAFVLKDLQVNSTNNVNAPKVISLSGPTCVFTYADFGGGHLYYRTFDYTALTLGTETAVSATLATGGTGSVVPFYDVCPVVGVGSDWVMAWGEATSVKVSRFSYPSTGVTTTTIARPAGATGNTLGVGVCCNSGEVCWVGYAYAQSGTVSTCYYRGLNPSLFSSTTVTENNVFTTTGLTGTSLWFVFPTRLNATTMALAATSGSLDTGTTGSISFHCTASSGGATGNTATYHWAIQSKCFVQGGSVYGMFLYSGVLPSSTINGATVTTRPTYVLAQLYDSAAAATVAPARPCATIAPRLGPSSSYIATGGGCPSFGSPSTGLWITTGNIERSSASASGLARIEIDFRSSAPLWQVAELGNELYVGGGLPSVYDGARVTEMGFLNPVGMIQNVAPSTTGGAILAGTYQYAAVFSWRDARGNVVRSTPCFSSNVVVGGATTGSVVFPSGALPTQGLTTKQDSESNYRPTITVDLYRTTAGPGSVFYKLISDANAVPLFNTVSGPFTAAYTDTLLDATLVANNFGTLYTGGGVLDGQCPSSLMPFIAHGKRLVGAGDDGVTLWFTTEYDGGTSQPRFNDALTLAVPDGGRCTGLASQDGNLYIFKRDRIFVMSGNGPNEQGQGSDWSTPQRIASDVGCTQMRSVVTSPMGVFFVYGGKVYLLSRGGEVMYVGAPMEQTLLANPFVTSAQLVPLKNEVRFTCTATDGATTGVTIVYNYFLKKWAKWLMYDADQAVASTSVTTAFTLQDVYYWGTSHGATYSENQNLAATNAYTDAGTWVTMTLESAWLKADGVAGFGRFRYVNVLGENQAPHDLTISVATDYNNSYTQTTTFTAAVLATFTTPLELASVHVANQKSAAIRIKITDAAPTGAASTTGAGPRLLGISVLTGIYPSNYRLPAQQGN